MSRTADDDETIRKRSGWIIPLGILLVTVGLSAAFLIYYLAPVNPTLFGKQINPTSRSDLVRLSLGGMHFQIPANYLIYAADRQGGVKKEIQMFALLPDLTGWSNWDADAFSSNSTDSRVVYLNLHQDRSGLSEEEKLNRVYRDYLSDQGTPAQFGLTVYGFREDTGYRGEELLAGKIGQALVLMRCVRASKQVPNPSCLREIFLTKGVSLSYRFKRSHLQEWQAIALKIDQRIKSFVIEPH
jgi:hypothetical protein